MCKIKTKKNKLIVHDTLITKSLTPILNSIPFPNNQNNKHILT